MKRLLFAPFLLALPVCAATNYNPSVGTIEWFIEKNNQIYQKQQIANPNSPKYNRTLGTMTKPIGTTKLPTYMPQRITQQSFARGIFNSLVRKHPVVLATTTAMAALEIYQCSTASSGWCHAEEVTECEPGSIPLPLRNACGKPAPLYGCKLQQIQLIGSSGYFNPNTHLSMSALTAHFAKNDFTRDPPYVCPTSTGSIEHTTKQRGTHDITQPTCSLEQPYQDVDFTFKNTITKLTSTTIRNATEKIGCELSDPIDTVTTTASGVARFTFQPTSEIECPVDYPQGPISYDDGETVGDFCFAPLNQPEPEQREVTLDDLKQWIAERPNIFDDVPDTVLKDPNTGKPDDTFFDKPKSTPISRQLSDAFEGLGTGLAQDNNPSAPYYIPPEIKPDVEEARDKFHDGEPFTDPFTNTTITPDPEPTTPDPYAPPAEVVVNLDGLTVDVEVDMNWDDFPGITQTQYEESNEKLSSPFENAEMPDIQSADNDFFETLQEPPPLPFSPFDFGSLWPISGGQCVGFTVEMSIRGDVKSVMMDRHCPPYNEWAHPLIAWFLQLLTALHIFHLFSRMISAG